jgi:polar amino acid transport system permease protein
VFDWLTPNLRDAILLYLSRLPAAALITLEVAAGAFVIGFVLGLLLTVMRLSRSSSLSAVAQGVIYFLRATPIPPFLYFIYFSILSLFFIIRPEHAGMLALGILLAPFMAEVFRSGVQSVSRGQIEAAKALGMSGALIWRRVIIPQTILIMFPAIGQRAVGILLDSAFVAVLGSKDITGMARNIINHYFSTELYLVVAATYFAVAYPLSRLLNYLEGRYGIER